jgi:hypothetical protein
LLVQASPLRLSVFSVSLQDQLDDKILMNNDTIAVCSNFLAILKAVLPLMFFKCISALLFNNFLQLNYPLSAHLFQATGE